MCRMPTGQPPARGDGGGDGGSLLRIAATMAVLGDESRGCGDQRQRQ